MKYGIYLQLIPAPCDYFYAENMECNTTKFISVQCKTEWKFLPKGPNSISVLIFKGEEEILRVFISNTADN
jgi:hypothetical protein